MLSLFILLLLGLWMLFFECLIFVGTKSCMTQIIGKFNPKKFEVELFLKHRKPWKKYTM